MKQVRILAVAFGLPLILIVLFAGYMYVSQMRVHPAYDVLYAVGSYGTQYYYVKDGTLVSEWSDATSTPTQVQDKSADTMKRQLQNTRFYRYDPTEDSTETVGSFADAQKLTIVSEDKSPDGYRVTDSHNTNSSIFGLFMGNSRTHAFNIEGEGGSKSISLTGSKYSTHIVGWIEK